MRGLRTNLIAAAALLAITLALSWPLALHLGDTLPQTSPGGPPDAWARADLDLLVWILAWTSRAIVEVPLSLFDANIFHPAPLSLAASENLIGLTPIATPVQLAFDNALLTYNITIIATIWIAALCTWKAVRDFGGAPAAAFFAACIFAFSPALTLGFTRLHGSVIGFFPLVLTLAFRLARHPTRGLFLALVLATALQLLAGVYLAFILAAFTLALSPGLIVTARRAGHSGAVPLLALALGALPLAALAIPYLQARSGGSFPSPEAALALIQAGSFSLGTIFSILGSGPAGPAIPFALLGLWQRDAPLALRASLLASCVLGGILATGTTLPLLPGTDLPGLYELAMAVVPGFSVMRAPSRFLALSEVSIAILAGLGLSFLLRLVSENRPRLVRVSSQGAIVILALALVAWRHPLPPLALVANPAAPLLVGAHQWLAENAHTGAVLDIPVLNSAMDGRLTRQNGRAMLGATKHWLPLLNGYSGYPPASHPLLMGLAQRLPDARAFADLCALTELRWIVAHHGLMKKRSAAFAAAAPELGLVPVTQIGRDIVYRVERSCGADIAALRARLAARQPTTLRGTSLESLKAEHRRGRLQLSFPAELDSGRFGWRELMVHNTSPATWPGLDLDGEGVIGVRLRWRNRDHGAVLEGRRLALGRDLGPGETMLIPVPLLTPYPGAWSLEIDLEQLGSGLFAETGGMGRFRQDIEITPG
ncbi:MAG: hypothetical protein VCC00_12480 [Deltaproteobacteria bacterium]